MSKVEFTAEDVSKGDYPHYMLKEIYEQPETIRDAMRGRLSREEATAKLGGLEMTPQELREVERIILTGCGTACHAALVGEYIIEALAHVPVEVEFASEFRYRNLPLPKDTLVFCISQSGETADTLAALRESQRKGLRTLGICNNVGSHHRPRKRRRRLHARRPGDRRRRDEILHLAGHHPHAHRAAPRPHPAPRAPREGLRIIDELEAHARQGRAASSQTTTSKPSRRNTRKASAMMFLGRQFNYPVALEGALKMKEISYIHASGHPSAELKHGVIALITPELPTSSSRPTTACSRKTSRNIEEVKARKGPIIAIGTEGCSKLEAVADDVICIPACPDFLTPILTSIPLQLLAYHTAVALGCDVDKPRNLAKSVTVE